jgi:DNA-directed RNA polymerase subunit M/transcription elongation factor TFIIS
MREAQFWGKVGELVDRSVHLIHYVDSSKLKSEDVSDFLVEMDSLASEWYNRSDDGKNESVPKKSAGKTDWVSRVCCPKCGSFQMTYTLMRRILDNDQVVRCSECHCKTTYQEARKQWEIYDDETQ